MGTSKVLTVDLTTNLQVPQEQHCIDQDAKPQLPGNMLLADSFPWQSRERTPKQFRKLVESLFMETCITFLIDFVKMC
jgi:hypothetical protein